MHKLRAMSLCVGTSNPTKNVVIVYIHLSQQKILIPTALTVITCTCLKLFTECVGCEQCLVGQMVTEFVSVKMSKGRDK